MVSIRRYIPNTLSIMRLLIAFIFPLVFFRDDFYISMFIFFIGVLTEFFDGYFARKWNVKSNSGKRIDHLADKWFIGMTLLSLAIIDNILIFVIFIIELLISDPNFITGIKDTYYTHTVAKIKLILLFITIMVGIYVPINSSMEIPFWILIGATFLMQLITIISYFNLSFQKKNRR
jgi:phosphatidylglycerophosphate synthase